MKIRIEATAAVGNIWGEFVIDIEGDFPDHYFKKTTPDSEDRHGFMGTLINNGIQVAVVSVTDDGFDNDVATVLAYGDPSKIRQLTRKYDLDLVVRRGSKLNPNDGRFSTKTFVTLVDGSDVQTLNRKGIATIETSEGEVYAFSKTSVVKGKKLGELKTSAEYSDD